MPIALLNAVVVGLLALGVCTCLAPPAVASDWLIRSLELGTPVENVDIVATPNDGVAIGYGLTGDGLDGDVVLSWWQAKDVAFDNRIDPGGGNAASFAADDYGNVFYAARDQQNATLRVGQDFAGFGPMLSSVHPYSAAAVVSAVPTMAIDGDGLPALAGIDPSGARFVSRFDVPQARWETDVIDELGFDSSTFPTVANSQALTFDTAGNGALCYVQRTGDWTGPLIVAREAMGRWTNVVNDTAIPWYGTSVAAAPDGSIGFAYVDAANQLTFGSHDDALADPQVIVAAIGHLAPRSLAYDLAGNPAVVYGEPHDEPVFNSLHFARRDSLGQWIDEVLPVIGPRASITFDSRGNPLIAAVTPTGVSLLSPALTWDGSDSNWGYLAQNPPPDSHWNGGELGTLPTPQIATAVNSGVSTIDDDRAALSLQIGDAGKVTIAPGGELTVGSVNVATDAALAIDGVLATNTAVVHGTLSGAGTIVGDLQMEGLVAPGNSTGVLTVQGSLQLGQYATYRCEIGQWDSDAVPDPWNPIPTAGPINDKIQVAGGYTLLAGTLELTALGKLSPPHPVPGNPQVTIEWFGDQTRTIVGSEEGSSISQAFGTVPEVHREQYDEDDWDKGHLGFGVFLADFSHDDPVRHPGISYGPNGTQVHLFQAADGDTNGDRRVDFADVAALLASGLWNKTEDPGDPFVWPPTWLQGDFTGDGLVSFADVAALLSTGLWNKGVYDVMDFGQPGGGKTFNSDPGDLPVVPEPSTVMLLLAGLSAWLLWRRTRQRWVC